MARRTFIIADSILKYELRNKRRKKNVKLKMDQKISFSDVYKYNENHSSNEECIELSIQTCY